jgi:hypothetical protein
MGDDHHTVGVVSVSLWNRRAELTEIIGDGRYIHWPDLDEDLTVAGILAGRPSHESMKSLKKWLAARPKNTKQRVRQVAEKKTKYRKSIVR